MPTPMCSPLPSSAPPQDIVDGLTLKTLSAALFMFFATFASTVALGDVAERETEGHVGISEYLILQGASGIVHSLVSACPMPILRPTGKHTEQLHRQVHADSALRIHKSPCVLLSPVYSAFQVPSLPPSLTSLSHQLHTSTLSLHLSRTRARTHRHHCHHCRCTKTSLSCVRAMHPCVIIACVLSAHGRSHHGFHGRSVCACGRLGRGILLAHLVGRPMGRLLPLPHRHLRPLR